MKVLITRAEPGAHRTAEGVSALGLKPVVAPMLTIRPSSEIDLDLTGVQALAFTSANGVRAWANARPERGLPALCVGDATEAAAKEAGFSETRSAGGDVGDLIHLIRKRMDKAAGRIVHVRGSHVTGDLAGSLREAGFEAEEAAAYEAVSANCLPDAAREGLEKKQLSLVLFHSSRAAAAFTALVDDADLTDCLSYLIAVAISDRAAESLIRSDWLAVKIADTPDEAALLDRVGAARLDP